MKKARNGIASSKLNDLNILPLSHCRSRFCTGQARLEASKSLPLKILARYDQKIFRWTGLAPTQRKGPSEGEQEHRKFSILNILRISPYGSIFYRRQRPSGHGNPLQFNILREFEEKNRTRLRRASLAFSIIYMQNIGNNRLIPEATRAPVRPAGARAGETPTAPLQGRRSARSGIPARSCAAARSAPPPDGIAQ